MSDEGCGVEGGAYCGCCWGCTALLEVKLDGGGMQLGGGNNTCAGIDSAAPSKLTGAAVAVVEGGGNRGGGYFIDNARSSSGTEFAEVEAGALPS